VFFSREKNVQNRNPPSPWDVAPEAERGLGGEKSTQMIDGRLYGQVAGFARLEVVLEYLLEHAEHASELSQGGEVCHVEQCRERRGYGHGTFADEAGVGGDTFVHVVEPTSEVADDFHERCPVDVMDGFDGLGHLFNPLTHDARVLEREHAVEATRLEPRQEFVHVEHVPSRAL